jgi:protein-S-isoprenylcysteine O-methyltransferase Ste14
MSLYRLATWVLGTAWALFLVIGYIQHRKLTQDRAERGEHLVPRRTDRRSDIGLALEIVAFLVLLPLRIPPEKAGNVRYLAVIVIGTLALLLYWRALLELGKDFRIRAVVTEEQHLASSGPYALVRHPIYLSVLLFLIATALYAATWTGIAISAAIMIFALELRIVSEEFLLAKQFGPRFEEYRRRTRAYIPYVR